MQITIEIDDTSAESINMFLSTQRRMELHPTTKAQMTVPIYSGVEGYVQQLVSTQVRSIRDQYPSSTDVEYLQRIAAIRAEMEAQYGVVVRAEKVTVPIPPKAGEVIASG